MIIFFIEFGCISKSFYLDVDPSETILEILKKKGLIDLEYLRKIYNVDDNDIHYYYYIRIRDKYGTFDELLKGIVRHYNIFKSIKDNNIKEYSVIEYTRIPFAHVGGGFIDNIKNEIDLNIGFDMSLIKRNELNVNLIHFDKNITNSENYGYFNDFKVDVVGGFYAIDDIIFLRII